MRRSRLVAAVALLATALAISTPAHVGAEPTAPGTEGHAHPGTEDGAGGGPVVEEIGGAQALVGPGVGRSVVMVDDAAMLEEILAGGIAAIDVWDSGFFGFVADLDPAEQARLRATPGVRSVEPDDVVDTAQTNPPWGLDRIDQRNLPLDGSYHTTLTGLGVTAYVIDSGLRFSHTEFAGRVAEGAYIDFRDGLGGWDCTGHGTHVAGTLGGTTYGVAKLVTIVPVRVLNCEGRGSTSQMIAGINWVIQHHAAGTPAVANLSVGGDFNAGLNAAVAALIADGVTVVIAAGNGDANGQPLDTCTTSPGSLPQAITVAASNRFDDDAPFSNYGPCNDLFAPGVGILSAGHGSDTATRTMSGTSMAAPHVAGAAALALQEAPASSPAQVWAALDGWSTKGVLDECCGDPDKLLHVPSGTAPTTPASPDGAEIVTVQPARVYDSRNGIGPARPGRSRRCRSPVARACRPTRRSPRST